MRLGDSFGFDNTFILGTGFGRFIYLFFLAVFMLKFKMCTCVPLCSTGIGVVLLKHTSMTPRHLFSQGEE